MTPQVGDKVVISSLHSKRIDTIIKVTKTQVTTASGVRFVIKTSRAVGDTGRWYRRYFQVVSPAQADELSREWEEAARKAELVSKLRKYDWATRNIDTLENIVSILDAAAK